MASYPTSIWSPPVRGTNMSDVVTQTNILTAQNAEIVAMQTEMGLEPSGSWASIAVRLRAVGTLCHLTRGASQNIANNPTPATAIAWDGQTLDPLNWSPADGVTTTITPTINGYYQMSFAMSFSADTDYIQVRALMEKNGVTYNPAAPYVLGTFPPAASVGPPLSGTFPLVLCNGTTDTLRLSAYQQNTNGGTNSVTAVCTVALVYPL